MGLRRCRSFGVVGLAASVALLLLPTGASGHVVADEAKRKPHLIDAAGGPLPFLWAWDPDDITISRGERARFRNPTNVTHHVVAWDGPWKLQKHLGSGDRATVRFKKRGVYKYWCNVSGHADIVYVGEERICVGMCGTITVE